jgi:hypothetical protein
MFTYMVMDEGVVAVSPTAAYLVLSKANRLDRWDRKASKKGDWV